MGIDSRAALSPSAASTHGASTRQPTSFHAMQRSNIFSSAFALALCSIPLFLAPTANCRAATHFPDAHILADAPFQFHADQRIFSPMRVDLLDPRIFSPDGLIAPERLHPSGDQFARRVST
jgi:hypothetical protein